MNNHTKSVFDFGIDLSNEKPNSKKENNDVFELSSILLSFFIPMHFLYAANARNTRERSESRSNRPMCLRFLAIPLSAIAISQFYSKAKPLKRGAYL